MIVSRSFTLPAIASCIAISAWLVACKLETEPENGAAGEITAFDLLKADNPGLTQDVIGSISEDAITLAVPANSDVTSLTPTIVYNGSALSPGSAEPQDFSDPVTYTVSTPGGQERTYTVTAVKGASSSKDILRFVIDDTRGTIIGSDIALTLPFGSDLSKLRPSVIHNGKTLSPESGAEQDFSRPVEYKVTAADGSTKIYRVTVSAAKSDAKEITAFTVGEISAVINGTQITLAMPYGTDLRTLEPNITHTGVSVSPDNGSTQDFRAPITYTVTAADGSTQKYTVQVSVTPNSAKEITRFSIGGRNAVISGTTITLTLPYGTNLMQLQPVVQHTGENVSPSSGAEQDFRGPVTYTVTAADGSQHQYTVTLSVAPSTAKEIESFEILGVTANISGSTITLTLPFGTPLTALAPTISHNGALIQPANGVAQNFSSAVNYVVTAADGSMRTYSVLVTLAQSSAKAITRFTLLGMDAVPDGDAITLSYPSGTDVHALTPSIDHTGASVSPPETQAQDFRQPVLYTVTAADGSTAMYTVTVTVAKNSSKDIVSFSILNRAAMVGANTVTLTLPYGTDLSQLTPTIMISGGASVSPDSMTVQNFTSPRTYRVTAENQTTKDYLVTVTAAPNPITSFVIDPVSANLTGHAITLTLPFNTNLQSLTPMITHTGKSIDPASNTPRDFSSPVTYMLVDQDDSVHQYTVTVSTAPPSANKNILTFELMGVTPISGPTIGAETISITVPASTDRSMLTPVITTNGASISPLSGVMQNFTMPVEYTVTAEDGSHKKYTVTVDLGP